MRTLSPVHDPALIEHANSPAYRAKLYRTMDTITDALKRRTRPYVAYSGGKDSTVVLALVEAVCPGITVAWTDDELEYAETVMLQEHVQQAYGEQYIVTLGRSQHAGWFTPWSDPDGRYWRDPLPGAHRKTIPQGDWMAARGYNLTFLGTRAAESQQRRDWLAGSGPTYRVKRGTGMHCCPLWDWTDDDVWALMAVEGLPVNGVYQQLHEIGVARTRMRVGPLPLSHAAHLQEGWPEMYERLVAVYGERWV